MAMPATPSSSQPLTLATVTPHRVWQFQSDLDDDDDDEGPPPMPESGKGLKACLEEEKNGLLWAQVMMDDAPTGPLAFIESTWFHFMTGTVIFSSAIIVGLETDYESPSWWWVEHGLLVFFATELGLRVCYHGGAVLFSPEVYISALLDLTVVFGGLLDLWVLPPVHMFTAAYCPSYLTWVENAQLTVSLIRIVRLLRLIRVVRPLAKLAIGVLEALQGMMWVLVFMVLMMYVVAVLCTRLIGHADYIARINSEKLSEIQELFGSVQSSMFVLFELMSCWSLIVFKPIFVKIPILKLFAVLFYIFSAWALLAVMTGVVSEKMIAVKEQVTSEEMQRDQQRQGLASDALHELFRKADMDGSGTISRDEFHAMLCCRDLTRSLLEHTVFTAQDMLDLFEWLDHDKDGMITIEEFLTGFRWLHEQISPKNFLKLQEELSTELRELEQRVLVFINERFDRLLAVVKQPLRKIVAVTEQIQRLDIMLSSGSRLGEVMRSRATRGAVAEFEQRVSSQIDMLLEAVERLEQLQAKGLIERLPDDTDAIVPVGQEIEDTGARPRMLQLSRSRTFKNLDF